VEWIGSLIQTLTWFEVEFSLCFGFFSIVRSSYYISQV
jgi:hypothetical protein